MALAVIPHRSVNEAFLWTVEALWAATPPAAARFAKQSGWRPCVLPIDEQEPQLGLHACVCDDTQRIIYFERYYDESSNRIRPCVISPLIHYHELGHVVWRQLHLAAHRSDARSRLVSFQAALDYDLAQLPIDTIEDNAYFFSPIRRETPPAGINPEIWGAAIAAEESHCELFGEHAAHGGGPCTRLLPNAASVVIGGIAETLPCLSYRSYTMPKKRSLGMNAASFGC